MKSTYRGGKSPTSVPSKRPAIKLSTLPGKRPQKSKANLLTMLTE